MAYASSDDMIARFGQTEMIRLTTPFGQDMTTVQTDQIDTTLDDASSVIDSYLRKRYATPVQAPPPELRRACQLLARYDLYQGEQKSPTDQVIQDRDATLSWLKAISRGEVTLDLREVVSADQSLAMTTAPDGGGDAVFIRGGGAMDDQFSAATSTLPTSGCIDAGFWGNP